VAAGRGEEGGSGRGGANEVVAAEDDAQREEARSSSSSSSAPCILLSAIGRAGALARSTLPRSIGLMELSRLWFLGSGFFGASMFVVKSVFVSFRAWLFAPPGSVFLVLCLSFSPSLPICSLPLPLSLSLQTTHVCSSSSFFWNALGRQSRRGAREDEEASGEEEEADGDGSDDDGADTSSLPVCAAFRRFWI